MVLLRHVVALLAAGLLLGVLPAPSGAARSEPPAPQVNVAATAAGAQLRLSWAATTALASATPPAPSVVALLLPDTGETEPQLTSQRRALWQGLALATARLPERTLNGERFPPLPGFASASVPVAPISLLREGRLRGLRIGVYALNPVYLEGETAYAVVEAEALVPGARPLNVAELFVADTASFATNAALPDPLAAQPAWKLRVATAGIQRLSAAELAAAGLDLAAIDLDSLQLRRGGQPVALELIRAGNGAPIELRFYAPAPGDRWSDSDLYWLSVGAGPSLRMDARAAPPGDAPVTDVALEAGRWSGNRLYESRLPGPDDDHFFSADLRVVPPAAGAPPQPAMLSAPITPTLPLAPGAATLIVGGASLYNGAHNLQVSLAGSTRTANWSGRGPWQERLSFPAAGLETALTLQPGAAPDGVHIDGVAWELPVHLEFGERGAAFVGRAGRWAYRLAGLPADATFYDLSDPAQPVRLLFAGDSFGDEAAVPRNYLVAGPGTLSTPTITAHRPVDLARPLDAQAVYIAPTEWIDLLAPLLEQRRAEGLSAVAVPVEAIYDGWSGGQTRPEAIRSFLRYAAATWAVAPVAVTLVGDGTSDPRNYLGRNNQNWLPPYLAPVDPWLGEAACEACYAQLHGANSLDDRLPDLAFGRIPAKSAAELAALIGKQLAYERDTTLGAWRATVAYIADNADLAGDFAAASDASAAAQPPSVRVARVYYDPAPPPNQPWREADPLRALARSTELLGGAAAIVQYTGHGLQFQWAYTGPPLGVGEPTDRQHLLGLYSPDELRNGGRLPVVLSMSCLTGSFQIPAFSGTSIDERLVTRPEGGAIATWSSTGLGVSYGHDALARGFYRALWAAPGQTRLGALAAAGYLELFVSEPCCQDSIRTFALLGDPLLVPRVLPNVETLSLPLISR